MRRILRSGSTRHNHLSQWSIVSAPIRLADHSIEPLYNIKAVVQATGISPSTLRAWERRYKMTQPQRSESGYRLYSDRDVAVIRWLKTQVDAGVAISQAVARLDGYLGDDAPALPGPLLASAPNRAIADAGAGSGKVRKGQAAKRNAESAGVRSLAMLRAELIDALVNYDESAADRIIAEAFSLYPVEDVGEELVRPVLVEIGERWHRNELSVVKEHFASNFLLQRMTALLRVARSVTGGPAIWVGCAPGELHEGGALLLAIYLRRAGFSVRYLGQDLPIEAIVEEASVERPTLLLLSASTSAGAEGLKEMAAALGKLDGGAPTVGFGGSIFVEEPALRAEMPGIWLGDSAQDAVQVISEILDRA